MCTLLSAELDITHSLSLVGKLITNYPHVLDLPRRTKEESKFFLFDVVWEVTDENCLLEVHLLVIGPGDSQGQSVEGFPV